ncbi:MAG TPA: hypothetical protein VGN32_02440 [Ktedonobacterales bacterium]|jgi:hypothetical protein|nr:hypothetical protein [Ktedonobacterales bacterium]
MSQQEPPAPAYTSFNDADTIPDTTSPSARGVHVPAGAAVPAAPAAHYNIFADLLRGIFQGAYAVDRLHIPGLLIWIAVGFVPVLGTLAAARDAYYCFEVGAWGSLLFNLVGLLPFMKGFATVLDVFQLGKLRKLSQLHRIHHVAHAAHQVAHAAGHGRMLRAGGRLGSRKASAITGVSHEAGAMVLVVENKRIPLRNGAAWPALLVALLAAVCLPPVMVLGLDILAGGAYLAYAVPLPIALGGGLVAVLCAVGVLLLARWARQTAKLLKGRPFSRGLVSLAAIILAWFTVLASLATLIAIVYIERGALPAL